MDHQTNAIRVILASLPRCPPTRPRPSWRDFLAVLESFRNYPSRVQLMAIWRSTRHRGLCREMRQRRQSRLHEETTIVPQVVVPYAYTRGQSGGLDVAGPDTSDTKAFGRGEDQTATLCRNFDNSI